MGFYERYELLELDRDDGVKTFQAREIETGRPVKVHLFTAPASPYQAQLLKKIDQLPESDRARILDRGKHEGTRYVVTDRLADYPGLFEWVSASVKAASGKTPLETAGAWKLPAASPESLAPVPDSPAGPSSSAPRSPAPTQQPTPASPALPSNSQLNREFADLFKTSERPVFVPPPDPAPSAPVPSAPVSAPAQPAPASAGPASAPPAEPGEFTRMFQAPGAASARLSSPSVPSPASPPLPAVPPPNAPAAPGGQEPGEFTRMFQAPAPPAENRPGAPPAPRHINIPAPRRSETAPPEPGEFTRMFQSPGSSPASPSAPPAAGTSGGQASGPGEFTRFFQAQSPAGPLPQSPAVQQPLAPQAPGGQGPNRAGEFTRMFGKDQVPAAPGQATSNAPPAPVSAPLSIPLPGSPPPVAATQAFSIPLGPPAQGGPPSPAAPAAPGEYTRMFSAPAPMTLGQAPVQQPAAQIPAGTPATMPAAKGTMPLIIGLVAIGVLALLIVAFFVLRPH